MANIVTIEVRAEGAKALDNLKKSLTSLGPAAVPVAAGLTAVAAQAGAAGAATVAFGAALGPQIKTIGEVAKNSGSMASAMTKIPPAAQAAAASLVKLNNDYQAWSDSLASDTMPVATKAFQTMSAVLPHLSGMVKGAAGQFDRLMNIIGGGVASGAFATLMQQFGDFSTGVLEKFTNGVISLSRGLSQGTANGPLQQFIEYAKANGPLVQETLKNIGAAVTNMISGLSSAGPSMLVVVNAMAKLVAAIPPEFIGVILKAYAAFKLFSTVQGGLITLGGALVGLRTQLYAMQRAAIAAGGGLAGMNAALSTMSTGGKALLAAGVVGALVLAVRQLSDNKAPVAVDELTTSLNTLASTGEVTGVLKTNFDEISKSIAIASKSASDNKILTMISDFGTWLGVANGPGISDAKANVDAWDKSMANMARSGDIKGAAAQYELLRKAWIAGGGDLGELEEETTDYKNALADIKFEAEMTAESMGVFGEKALETQRNLDAQRTAADSLRQALVALNDTNRSAYDTQIAFESSLDALTKSFREHGATLNLDTEAGQKNGQAMSAAAKAHDEMIVAGIAAGDTLETMAGKSSKLREEMLAQATAALGSKEAATEYVNTLLGTPESIATQIKLEKEAATADLTDFFSKLAAEPNAKAITIDALTSAGEAKLESFGLMVERLPNGKIAVTAKTGQAVSDVKAVQRARDALSDKTITITVAQKTIRSFAESMSSNAAKSGGATGGLFTGKAFRYADGGSVVGPGTGTSDDVPAPWLSNGEWVMKKSAVDKYGEKFMQRVNDGKLEGPGYARGGKVSDAMRDARSDLASQFGMNRFGRMAGWSRTPFEKGLGAPGDLNSLVDALTKARGGIKAATSGGVEKRLLSSLDVAGRALIRHEKHLNSVNKALESAKDRLSDLKSAAASLSSSVKSGVLGAANITRGATGGGRMTVESIMGGLTASRDKATAFASALKQLKKKGLDKGLIEEIAQAGIEGGGLETAGAVLNASKSEIASMNKLRASIAKAAGTAGATASDAMYGAGIKAAEGLVKGLQSQQAAIAKQMMDLAKYMEFSIKKALGIKSPSKVMEEVGAFTAEGFAIGIERNSSVKPAWSSMLNAPRTGSSSGVTSVGGSGGQPMYITLQIGEKKFGEIVVDSLRGTVRSKGGNVQGVVGS